MNEREMNFRLCFDVSQLLFRCSAISDCAVPCRLFADGISVTGLPISSPLRQVLKPRSDSRPVSSESGKAEYNHVKVIPRLLPASPEILGTARSVAPLLPHANLPAYQVQLAED